MEFDVFGVIARPEIVSGLFGLLTAIVTGVMARGRINAKRLKEKLERAEKDIAFLLCVERIHLERNQAMLKSSHKNRTRAEAFKQGFEWSGSFTPGRVRASSMHDSSAFTTTFSAHLIVLSGRIGRSIAAGAAWVARKAASVGLATINRMRSKRSAQAAT